MVQGRSLLSATLLVAARGVMAADPKAMSGNAMFLGLKVINPKSKKYAYSPSTNTYGEEITDAKIANIAYPFVDIQIDGGSRHYAGADGFLYATENLRENFKEWDTADDDAPGVVADDPIDVPFGIAMQLFNYMPTQAFQPAMKKKTGLSHTLQKAVGMVYFIDANKALLGQNLTDEITVANYYARYYAKPSDNKNSGPKFADPIINQKVTDDTEYTAVLEPEYDASAPEAMTMRPFIMCVNLTHQSGALVQGPQGIAVISQKMSNTLPGTPSIYAKSAKLTVTSVLSKSSEIASGQNLLHKTKLQYPTDLKSMMANGQTKPIVVYLEYSHQQNVYQNWMGQIIKTSMDESHLSKLNRYITNGKIDYWGDNDKLTQFKRYTQMYKIYTIVDIDVTKPITEATKAYLHFLDGELVFLTQEALEKLSPSDGTRFQIFTGYQFTENQKYAISGTYWSDAGVKAVRDANVVSGQEIELPPKDELQNKDEEITDKEAMQGTMRSTRYMETIEDISQQVNAPPNLQMTVDERHRFMAMRNSARIIKQNYVRQMYKMMTLRLQPTRLLETVNKTTLTQENLYGMATTICADIGCGTRKIVFIHTYPGSLKFYSWKNESSKERTLSAEQMDNLYGMAIGLSAEDKEYPKMVSSVKEKLVNCNVFTPQGEAGTCFSLKTCNGGCAKLRIDNFASGGVDQCSTGVFRVGPQTDSQDVEFGEYNTLMDNDRNEKHGALAGSQLKDSILGVCAMPVFNECENANSGFKLLQSNLTAYICKKQEVREDSDDEEDDDHTFNPLYSPAENKNPSLEWNNSLGELIYQEEQCGQCCSPCASTTVYLAGYNETTGNATCTVCCASNKGLTEDADGDDEHDQKNRVLKLIQARNAANAKDANNHARVDMFTNKTSDLGIQSEKLYENLVPSPSSVAFNPPMQTSSLKSGQTLLTVPDHSK